ncbi:MAG: glycosyltransferase family 2 protein [Opitutaceae bacterium]
MKLVAVSIVKNEADIIEAFVRHTHAWVDYHLIFDHDSTDGTREILAELVREGLPLALFTDDVLANLQHTRSNHLARLAFTDHEADWVIPLDADEVLCAPSRAALEQELMAGPFDQGAALRMHNYVTTPEDDPSESNPIRRLRYRRPEASTTVKITIPRRLGVDSGVVAGKGNHALYRGPAQLPARLLTEAWLAHFSLRSPHQQMLRVLTAELQKLARGRAHEGLDVHYRPGFQLLAEDPERFLSTVLEPAAGLTLDPAPYRGGPLRHSLALSALARTARALVPFLEKLAVSHGRLVDQLPTTAADAVESPASVIRPLDAMKISPLPQSHPAEFSGFVPGKGWEALGGPVAEAFLPLFHWTLGPETHLTVNADRSKICQLEAEAMTYVEPQVLTILLNGIAVHRFAFPRIYQKERLSVALPLRPGENQLLFRTTAWLEAAHDPRHLALIFLSLRVSDPA